MSLRTKLRILVVDDMAVSRGLLIQALEHLRIENYKHVGNGEEAVQLLQHTPFHLVISDYNMPVMDGLELLRVIRGTQATAKLGFIMVTGSVDNRLIQQGAALGMNNFLRKPFDPAGLKNCIEQVFGRL